MEDATIKAIVAMGCITALEIAALVMGINGSVLALVVAALAGIAGYEIHKYRVK